ncbi:hypothetical protein IWZ00DRAFT_217009 [Phyllosticta capitalensis]|uniref:Uncharacterized protein n=1 Tax=Phyllosticta capitalensis TaxID=121624 RepID=A0ABR1YSQ0_9PEZI
MGWFSSSSDDPSKNLDPQLKEFLDQELSHFRAGPPAVANPPPKAPEPTQQTTQSNVPRESLYQDGRYAHLWKTYQPINEVEARFSTEREQMSEISSTLKDQVGAVKKAAMENCSIEDQAINECYKSGTWMDRMMMCRKENKAFNRCWTMQTQFLKALGYLGVAGRDPEMEEKVQMHADRLYHQMLEQERLIKEAKARGEQPPDFDNVLSGDNVAVTKDAANTKARELNAEAQRQHAAILKKKFEEQQQEKEAERKRIEAQRREAEKKEIESMPISATLKSEIEGRLKDRHGLDRDLEFRAIKAEIAQRQEIANNSLALIEKSKANMLARREAGQQTMGDRVKRWWGGWD